MASLFLKIDGITGECMDEKYKGWIELESFHWGANHPSSAGGGSGSSAGRVNFHSVTAVAKLDKAYPDLMQPCATAITSPRASCMAGRWARPRSST
jgi:type VI secretion system secreted protein Hcp